jgi:hypothetical protein
VGALDHPLARSDLGLPEVEDRDAIGVGKVVGNAEGLGLVIVLATKVMPDDSLAGPAERLSIAKRKTRLQLPVVRLAGRLKTTTGRPGIQ